MAYKLEVLFRAWEIWTCVMRFGMIIALFWGYLQLLEISMWCSVEGLRAVWCSMMLGLLAVWCKVVAVRCSVEGFVQCGVGGLGRSLCLAARHRSRQHQRQPTQHSIDSPLQCCFDCRRVRVCEAFGGHSPALAVQLLCCDPAKLSMEMWSVSLANGYN